MIQLYIALGILTLIGLLFVFVKLRASCEEDMGGMGRTFESSGITIESQSPIKPSPRRKVLLDSPKRMIVRVLHRILQAA